MYPGSWNFICSDFMEHCYVTHDLRFSFWMQMCSRIWTTDIFCLSDPSKSDLTWWSNSDLHIQWVLNSSKDKQVYLNILIYNFIFKNKNKNKNQTKTTKINTSKRKKKNQQKTNTILLQNVFCKLFLLSKQEKYQSSTSVLTFIKIFCVFVYLRESNFL